MSIRRILPIVVLGISLVAFVGAIAYALRPAPARVVAPTAAPRAAVQAGSPTSAATSTASAEPTATAPATPTVAATPAQAAMTATATATQRATPNQAVSGGSPTVAALPVAPTTVTTASGAAAGVTATTVAPALTPTLPPAPPTPTATVSQASAAPTIAAPPATATPVPVPTATPLPPPQPTATRPAPPPPPPPAGRPPGAVGLPRRLIIPSLTIDAAIEFVGVDKDGNMDVPQNPWNTAWYEPGVRPGQPGNAAIAGHVDYHDIGEVVFWHLNEIEIGAEIRVVTDDGKTLRFQVQEKTYFFPASAPLQRIFGPANTPNLNIITCGGTFNPSTRQYDQRLVVFTTFVGQE